MKRLGCAPTRVPVTVALLAGLLAPAVRPQEGEDATFGETVDVELVNVEVWVTDVGGQPVTGLTAADFEVRDDGEPVTVTHFAELRGTGGGRTETVSPLPVEAARAETRAAPGAEPGALIVYFDQLHLRPAYRKRVVGDLRRFLASEDLPAERILVLRQEHDLLTEAPFGSSRAEIDAALSRIATTAGVGARAGTEKRLALGRLQELWEQAQELARFSSPCDWFSTRAAPEVTAYAQERRARLAVTLGHLRTTASFLAGVPGLKTLLYVSDSLEITPGIDLQTFVEGLCPEQREITKLELAGDLREPFEQLTRHANANRVTLYTLQAGGLRSSFLGTSDQRSLDLINARSFESALKVSERDGLALLADETGGRAIFDKNRFGNVLESIARDMTSYYSLAYAPPRASDGAEHRVEVEAGAKLRVRHRRSYRDKGPDERMFDRLTSALYLGLMSNPLGARLGAGTVRAGTDDKFTLPLHVIVPAERVTFLPSSGARLTVQVAACDDRNRNVAFEQKLFRFDEPARQTDGALLDLAVDLEIDPGAHVVGVAVRDEASRETSYVSTTLSVRDPGAAGR